jgi:hypothetical protein
MNEDLLNLALSLFQETSWKLKRNNQQEKIYCLSQSHGKVYRVIKQFDCRAKYLNDLILSNSNNPLVVEMTQLECDKANNTDIIRVISSPGGGGVVSSKEFINKRIWREDNGKFLIVAKSLDNYSHAGKFPRGKNFMAWLITPNDKKCTLDFLMSFDINHTIHIEYIFLKSYLKHLKRYAVDV